MRRRAGVFTGGDTLAQRTATGEGLRLAPRALCPPVSVPQDVPRGPVHSFHLILAESTLSPQRLTLPERTKSISCFPWGPHRSAVKASPWSLGSGSHTARSNGTSKGPGAPPPHAVRETRASVLAGSAARSLGSEDERASRCLGGDPRKRGGLLSGGREHSARPVPPLVHGVVLSSLSRLTGLPASLSPPHTMRKAAEGDPMFLGTF